MEKTQLAAKNKVSAHFQPHHVRDSNMSGLHVTNLEAQAASSRYQ